MSEITPEERAEGVTRGWLSIRVEARPLSSRVSCTSVDVGGDMVPAVRRSIAGAIREAVLAEREACARVVEGESRGDGEPEQLRDLTAAIRAREGPPGE